MLLALVLLLVLSLLAVSGMQGSLMQERMSSAQREGTLALEAAESGARDAERYIEDNLVNVADFGATGPFIDATDEDVERPDPHDPDFWADEDQTRTGDAVDGVTPRYYIEYLGEGFEPEQRTDGMITGYSHDTGAGSSFAFRTVIRATGPSGSGQRLIEVYYTRRL